MTHSAVSKTTTPGLRERNKAKRRSAIIDAALRLFVENGYEATTIADIAAVAEVAPRTVSLYFATKHDILIADAVDRTERLRERLHNRQSEQPVFDLFSEWVREEYHPIDPERWELRRQLQLRHHEVEHLAWARIEPLVKEGIAAFAEEIGVDLADPRPQLLLFVSRGVIEFITSTDSPANYERALDISSRFFAAGVKELQNL